MIGLAERVLSGDTRAAARLCRLVDDRAPDVRELLRPLYAAPRAPAYVVGVTGTPGAGKSTLVDRLVAAYRAEGGRVGVVAVDPTSPFTGGAILGDRIRMQRHFEDPDVFIRSLATRGALGGLSRSARDVVRVLEAWGARVVLVETVGVGQDEVDVARLSDSTVVVVVPGQGDDVQASKAGILECADVFVVNKADRPGAEATVRDLEGMLALGVAVTTKPSASVRHGPAAKAAAGEGAGAGGAWIPPVVKTVATSDEGIPELVGALGRHLAWTRSEAGQARRLARARWLLEAFLREAIADELSERLETELDAAASEIESGRLDPHSAVERLVAALRR
jgi:LAO/AO transport system kinase